MVKLSLGVRECDIRLTVGTTGLSPEDEIASMKELQDAYADHEHAEVTIYVVLVYKKLAHLDVSYEYWLDREVSSLMGPVTCRWNRTIPALGQ